MKISLIIVLSFGLAAMSAPQVDRPKIVRTPVIRRPVSRPQVVRDEEIASQLTDPRIRIPNHHKTAPDGGNCCQSDFPAGYGSCRVDADCTEDPKNPYCSAFGFCIPTDNGTDGCKACKVLRRCQTRKGC